MTDFEVGFRKIEGFLVALNSFEPKTVDQEKALYFANNLCRAFYIEGFVNDILERHLALNGDKEASQHPNYRKEPEVIIKLRIVFDRLKLDLSQIDGAVQEIEMMCAARNKLVHPKSQIGDAVKQKVQTSDWMGHFVTKDTFENLLKAQDDLVKYVLGNSDYKYPIISGSITRDVRQ